MVAPTPEQAYQRAYDHATSQLKGGDSGVDLVRAVTDQVKEQLKRKHPFRYGFDVPFEIHSAIVRGASEAQRDHENRIRAEEAELRWIPGSLTRNRPSRPPSPPWEPAKKTKNSHYVSPYSKAAKATSLKDRNEAEQAKVSLRGATAWREAELRAGAFMRALGLEDVNVTQASVDDGVDVTAKGWAAQVKHQATAVGGPVVQNVLGAATVARKKAMCFSLSGYTTKAIAHADAGGVALFRYDVDWEYTPASDAARGLARDG